MDKTIQNRELVLSASVSVQFCSELLEWILFIIFEFTLYSRLQFKRLLNICILAHTCSSLPCTPHSTHLKQIDIACSIPRNSEPAQISCFHSRRFRSFEYHNACGDYRYHRTFGPCIMHHIFQA